MENILEIEGLCKSYGSFRLDNVSFAVPEGCVMGFIGENGAGKTTTIKAVLNLIHKDAGEIRVFGLDSEADETKIKADTGVFLDGCSFSDQTNTAQISMIMSKIHPKWDKECFQQYCRQFGLPDKKEIKLFSKGMQTKLSLAVAMSHHPKLMILDEPTSGLDPIVRDEILDIFRDFILEDDHAILFSSHITSDIEKIADYVTFIHEGKIIFSEMKDDLLHNSGILKLGIGELNKLDREDVISVRRSQYQAEVLVHDQQKIRKKYPSFVVDNATLEEIMLFYVKGEQV